MEIFKLYIKRKSMLFADRVFQDFDTLYLKRTLAFPPTVRAPSTS